MPEGDGVVASRQLIAGRVDGAATASAVLHVYIEARKSGNEPRAVSLYRGQALRRG